MKYSPPNLELSHILIENLKPITMHHVWNTLFHQHSGLILTYITEINSMLIYTCTVRLVTWYKRTIENMLSLRFQSRHLRWKFGALLFHRLNITLQTNSNFILFSIKDTIPYLTNFTPIHPKIRAGRYEKNVWSFLLNYQLR